jgi:hypothetical protein
MAGELVVYDPDETHAFARLKIGDGVTSVVDLPFHGSITDLPEDFEINLENYATKDYVAEELSKIENTSVAVTDADLTLSSKFIITKDFGYYTLDGAASKEIGTIGQSLHEFLQEAFAQEDKTIFSSTPSCSISMSGGTYEIGSTVNPSASWSTDAGTYN